MGFGGVERGSLAASMPLAHGVRMLGIVFASAGCGADAGWLFEGTDRPMREVRVIFCASESPA